MNVEFTQRNYDITPTIRKQITGGINKLAKIIGDNFDTNVILAVEKHRSRAELTVSSPNRGQVVGEATAAEMSAAVDAALDRIEAQFIKNKARWRDLKRQPKAEKFGTESPRVAATPTATPATGNGSGAHAKTIVAHLVKGEGVIADEPMTIEEAVKECEYRERGILVFRDTNQDLKVLHVRKDGKLELIEVA